MARIHIVSGFLGSGKTTAVAGAARHLISKGVRAAALVNDHGRRLVDTAFLRALHVPVAEVTGACLFERPAETAARLEALLEQSRAQAVFVEVVGSCGCAPGSALKLEGWAPASWTVFADARVMQSRMADKCGGFGPAVGRLLDRQYAAAGMLVINKADLLAPAEAADLAAQARERFPGRQIRVQNSLDAESVAMWAELAEAGRAAPLQGAPGEGCHADGDDALGFAWLDEKLEIRFPAEQGRAVVERLVEAVAGAMAGPGMRLGHLKLLLKADTGVFRLGITDPAGGPWREEIPALDGHAVQVILNARAEGAAEDLRRMVQTAIHSALDVPGVELRFSGTKAFTPDGTAREGATGAAA